MIILSIRTDKPQAEISLFQRDRFLDGVTWEAHRQLAETLHQKIIDLLTSQKKSWSDIEGIVIFQGPGSFTGLRIGISVANALAYARDIPILAASGDNWQTEGRHQLQAGKNAGQVAPKYGSLPHITQAKK